MNEFFFKMMNEMNKRFVTFHFLDYSEKVIVSVSKNINLFVDAVLFVWNNSLLPSHVPVLNSLVDQ